MYTRMCDHVAGSFMFAFACTESSLVATLFTAFSLSPLSYILWCQRLVPIILGDQRLIIMVVELTPCPEGWLDCSTFMDEYSGIQEEDYFACGAVELAKKLVGEWLYCHRTKIAVRILETEAYPEDEADVYSKVFVSQHSKSKQARS